MIFLASHLIFSSLGVAAFRCVYMYLYKVGLYTQLSDSPAFLCADMSYCLLLGHLLLVEWVRLCGFWPALNLLFT